jgi:hypothetical protein
MDRALSEASSNTALASGLRPRPLRAAAFGWSPSGGQAVGDPRQGQDIRRVGEQEATRPIVLIDRLLDGQQQVRRALDFIDNGPIEAADEAGGIGPGGLKDRLIVERDIGPPGVSHFSDECGLAGTARAYDQDHRRIRKGFLRPSLHKPLEHAVFKSKPELSVSAGWESMVR